MARGAQLDQEDADMMSIGVHCAFPECRQLDFLPFKCSCGGTFCLDHRLGIAHNCKLTQGEQSQVVICPVCALSVKLNGNEDPNLAFERHSRTDCDPSNYNKVHKKKRCPAANCREKLTSINSFVCKECNVTVCLKHRLGTDHQCPGRPASAAAAAGNRLAAFRSMFTSSNNANTTNKQPSRNNNASTAAHKHQRPLSPSGTAANTKQKLNTAMRTASANVQSQLQQYRQRHSAANQPQRQPQNSKNNATGPELCTQCGARFMTVQQLIDHASTAHANGWASGGNIGSAPGQHQAANELERCPRCGFTSSDPIDLINHVEGGEGCPSNGSNTDGQRATETCVLF